MATTPDDLLDGILALCKAVDDLSVTMEEAEYDRAMAGREREYEYDPFSQLILERERLREPPPLPGEQDKAGTPPTPAGPTDELIQALDRLTKATEKGHKPAGPPLPDMPRRGSRFRDLLGAYQDASLGTRTGIGQLRSGHLGGALQGFMGAGRGAAGAAGAMGAAAMGAGVIAGVVVAMAAFKVALDAATRATIQHHRKLGEVSAVMAAVLAQRDVREMLRDQEKGHRLAGAASRLTRAEQDRADAGKEIDIAWQEFKSGFLTEYNRMMAGLLREVTDMVKWAKSKFGIQDAKKTDPPFTLYQMAEQVEAQVRGRLDRHRAKLPAMGKGPGE